MVPGLDSSGHMQWRLDLAPMGNMAIYDTVRGTWTSKITAGSIPAPRTQHSAVLGELWILWHVGRCCERIITIRLLQLAIAPPSLSLVDRDVSDFQGYMHRKIKQLFILWSVSADTGTNLYNDLYTYNTNMASWTHIEIPNGPSPRYGHSGKHRHAKQLSFLIDWLFLCQGVQFNETMFVLFGLDSTNQSLGDIYALDTVNWKWITQFNPNGYPQQPNGNYTPAINTTTSSSGSSSPTASSGGGLTAGPIAGIAVGGIALLVSNVGIWQSWRIDTNYSSIRERLA